MHTAPNRPSQSLFAPTLLLAALAAAGLGACGGSDDNSSSISSAEQRAQDIKTAQTLFTSLRNNATALNKADFVDPATGVLSRGVESFGAAVQKNAVPLATDVADSIRLDQMAFNFWEDYRAGRTPSNSVNNASISSGCTVFQGVFPVSVGSLPPVAVEFPPSSVAATSSANASWVGCSKTSGPLTTSARFVQTKLYNMGKAVANGVFPASVDYLAVTRSERLVAGVRQVKNLSGQFSGIVGFPAAGGTPSGFTLQGDLAPLTDGNGNLLAGSYRADIRGRVDADVSGGRRITFDGGKITEAPVGAAPGVAALTIDLSNAAAGITTFVIPNDDQIVAQRTATKANLFATIFNANGTLTGSFLADDFDPNPANPLNPRQAKFDGKLTLVARPEAELSLTVTAPSTTSGTLVGSYKQSGLTVNFNGTRTATVSTLAISDSNGVSTTIASNANSAPITVGGRHVGDIKKDTGMIVFLNGDIQSLQ